MIALKIFTYIVSLFIVYAAIYLSIKTSLLKGTNEIEGKYSFSRVQLLWWTVIISCCYIILFGMDDGYKFNFFNSSTLTLLSIGIVTSAGANVIDTNQKESGKKRHQEEASKGFFHDIMSDENGISVARLQAVIFNILFAIVFIVYMIDEKKFPNFNDNELTMLGVSSGAYLSLKTNENKDEKEEEGEGKKKKKYKKKKKQRREEIGEEIEQEEEE